MATVINCPYCGKENPAAAPHCIGCCRELPPQGAARPAAGAGPVQGNGAKTWFNICAGLLVFVLVAQALYRNLPRHAAGNTPSWPAGQPEKRQTGGGRDMGIIPGAPGEPDIVPLSQSQAALEKNYGPKMKLAESATISAGPLEGGLVKAYKTETAIDELTARDGRLYRRSLSFNIREIGEGVGSFSALVYILALYQTAANTKYTLETAPAELRAEADAFGAACAALRAGGAQEAEADEVHGDFRFSCVNAGGRRMKYEVSSEGLFQAERTRK